MTDSYSTLVYGVKLATTKIAAEGAGAFAALRAKHVYTSQPQCNTENFSCSFFFFLAEIQVIG
jgi:hypothetical protein